MNSQCAYDQSIVVREKKHNTEHEFHKKNQNNAVNPYNVYKWTLGPASLGVTHPRGKLGPWTGGFCSAVTTASKIHKLISFAGVRGSWQQAIRELGLGPIAIERLVLPLLPRGSRVVYIICKFNDVHYNVLHNRPTLNHGSKHPAWLQKVVIIEILFDFLCAGCNGLVFAS